MKSLPRKSALLSLLPLLLISASAQSLDNTSVVQHIDAAVHSRFDNVLAFTVTETYRIFRNNDEQHPVAEMTVKDDYQKETGKTFTILSQSGSVLMRHYVLTPLLDNEKRINLPGTREAGWFNSQNYDFKLKSTQTVPLNGHNCFVLSMNPRQKASNLLIGTIWVDATDFTTVQIQGATSKDPSVLSGPTELLRQYTKENGYAQSFHSRAVSASPVFGQTVITIDYNNYQVQVRK
jgi:hypothetical protein